MNNLFYWNQFYDLEHGLKSAWHVRQNHAEYKVFFQFGACFSRYLKFTANLFTVCKVPAHREVEHMTIKPKQAIMSFLWNMDGSNGIDSTCPKKANSYLITRTKEAQKASK